MHTIFLLSLTWLWQSLAVTWTSSWNSKSSNTYACSPVSTADSPGTILRRTWHHITWLPCLGFLWDGTMLGLEKVQGATRLGATGLRASEGEICLWEDLWKPLKILWKPLKTSKNLWKASLSETLSEADFPLEKLSVLLPLFICHLNSLREPAPPPCDCASLPGSVRSGFWGLLRMFFNEFWLRSHFRPTFGPFPVNDAK